MLRPPLRRKLSELVLHFHSTYNLVSMLYLVGSNRPQTDYHIDACSLTTTQKLLRGVSK
jgi:hypothetical protein